MVSSVDGIEEGEELVISDLSPLSGVTFRVSDKEVEDIGITETFAVTLVSASARNSNYALVGTTADSAVTLTELIDGDGGAEYQVFWKQIEHR